MMDQKFIDKIEELRHHTYSRITELQKDLCPMVRNIYMNHQYEASHELTIDDFFEIIKAVRDIVAHEGNYWEMQFFALDDDSTWIASLETDRQILKSYKYQNQKK